MAIEFRCTQCGKLLRTGDETAGKQAKCPQCSAVMTIPAAGSAVPPPPLPPGGSPFGAAPSQPGDSGNPYQSPTPFAPIGSGQPQGGVTPTLLDLNDIFNRTWAIFKEQWGMCLVAVVLVGVINFGVSFLGSLGVGIVGAILKSEGIAVLLNLIVSLATNLFSVWLGIGQAKYFLKVARGQPAEIGDLFTGGTHFVSIFLGSLLFGLIILLGFLALIVPGIILCLMFSQFYYLILDRNSAVIDSLSQSKELMDGNKLTLFLIWLVSGVVGGLLVVFTCGLGLLAVAPFLVLMAPVIYLAITGQPTADQARQTPLQ